MIYNMRRRKKKVSLKWYFNTNLKKTTNKSFSLDVAFKSRNRRYLKMKCNLKSGSVSQLIYATSRDSVVWDQRNTWYDEGYRTVEFEKEPTGELLKFLQQNATPL